MLRCEERINKFACIHTSVHLKRFTQYVSTVKLYIQLNRLLSCIARCSRSLSTFLLSSARVYVYLTYDYHTVECVLMACGCLCMHSFECVRMYMCDVLRVCAREIFFTHARSLSLSLTFLNRIIDWLLLYPHTKHWTPLLHARSFSLSLCFASIEIAGSFVRVCVRVAQANKETERESVVFVRRSNNTKTQRNICSCSSYTRYVFCSQNVVVSHTNTHTQRVRAKLSFILSIPIHMQAYLSYCYSGPTFPILIGINSSYRQCRERYSFSRIFSNFYLFIQFLLCILTQRILFYLLWKLKTNTLDSNSKWNGSALTAATFIQQKTCIVYFTFEPKRRKKQMRNEFVLFVWIFIFLMLWK